MEKTSNLYKVLSFINDNPGLMMKEIKERLGKEVNPNTISYYLDGYRGYTSTNHHWGGYKLPSYIKVDKSLNQYYYHDSHYNSYIRRFYLTDLGMEQLSK